MIESMTIRITNFDNDAMVDNPAGEVVTILKKLIADIEQQGLEELDGTRLLESNGNSAGRVTVTNIDEDDFDDVDQW